MQSLSLITENQVDLVVMDVNMPVTIRTARLDRRDIKKGFGPGAINFIRRPFGKDELTLRINAVLRRSTTPEAATSHLSNGSPTMDLEQHFVTADR